MSQDSPVVHVITDPVLLDKEIAAIQAKLATLTWLQFSFARAIKMFRINGEGTKVSFPAIFQAWKEDYYDAFPNDNIISYSFIFVDPSSVVEFNSKRIHNIEQPI